MSQTDVELGLPPKKEVVLFVPLSAKVCWLSDALSTMLPMPDPFVQVFVYLIFLIDLMKYSHGHVSLHFSKKASTSGCLTRHFWTI